MAVRPGPAEATDDGGAISVAVERSLESETVRLGRVLRAARGDRYSLETLAQRSGVSAGLLSQIERGIGNPSFHTLLRVSAALGLSMSDLLERRSSTPAEDYVVRAGQRRSISWPNERHAIEVLTPRAQRSLSVMRVTMPAGTHADDVGDPELYRGTICFIVISGVLRIDVDGVPHDLAAGDTLTARSELIGTVRVISDQDSQALQILTPGGL